MITSDKDNKKKRVCHGFMTHPFFFLHLLFFVTQISQMTQIFLRGIILSHRFQRYTQIFFRGIIFVTQISQMTQIFLRGIIFVPQISQMTQIFLRGIIFVPQISQIYTDFSSWDYFCHADFADLHRFFFVGLFLSHRFHRFTQIFLRGIIFVPQISQMTQIFLRGIIFVPQISQIYTDFSSWDYFCPADFTDIHRFFFVGLFLSHRFTQIFLNLW